MVVAVESKNPRKVSDIDSHVIEPYIISALRYIPVVLDVANALAPAYCKLAHPHDNDGQQNKAIRKGPASRRRKCLVFHFITSLLSR